MGDQHFYLFQGRGIMRDGNFIFQQVEGRCYVYISVFLLVVIDLVSVNFQIIMVFAVFFTWATFNFCGHHEA